METGINTTGKVRHIEVVGDTVMWSVDELVAADQPDLTVGTVYLLNNADMSSIPIKVYFISTARCILCNWRGSIISYNYFQ